MLKNPLVFIFNILESQHAIYRTSLYDHLRLIFEQDRQECIFLPIRNSKHSDLAGRAKMIDSKLRQIGSAHIIALSVSGVDCRMALHAHDTPMQSLFTISSPHNGSSLAKWAYSPEKNMEILDPIVKFLGIPFEAFQELRTDKISKINRSMPVHSTPISSTTSRKTHESMCDLLKPTGKRLQGEDEMVLQWNDGVFYVNEMKWGSHLISFEGDHTEIVGSSLNVNCAPLFRLAMDNARRHELHREDRIAS